MQYDVADFIGDLEVAFPRYPSKDETAEARWVDLVKRKLGGYKPIELKDAAEALVTLRTAKGFPSLAEMLKACDKAKPRKPVETDPQKVHVTPGQACAAFVIGEKFWEKCVYHERRPKIFEKSAKEGWHMTLKSFMVNNRRMPNDSEVASIQAEALMFLEAYEDCVRGGFPNAKQLEGLGDAMLAERERWRKIILGEN